MQALVESVEPHDSLVTKAIKAYAFQQCAPGTEACPLHYAEVTAEPPLELTDRASRGWLGDADPGHD